MERSMSENPNGAVALLVLRSIGNQHVEALCDFARDNVTVHDCRCSTMFIPLELSFLLTLPLLALSYPTLDTQQVPLSSKDDVRPLVIWHGLGAYACPLPL